jgi:TIR domain/Domain of unknown function (DUF4062)
MAYLPGFVNDVFISYTHKDNIGPEGEPGAGWVSRFHLDLQRRLTELLGVPAGVWRDKKLRGSDDFDEEIFAQLRRSAVLVPIVSPGYLRSTYCQNELEEFQKAALQTGGLHIGNFVRAVKAVKTPLDQDRHREVLGQSLGHEFYSREPDSNYFNAFRSGTDAYENRLDRLAQDIAEALKTMAAEGATKKKSKATVYLAETSSDLKSERQRLLDELLAQGYRVLPDEPLPEYAAEIRRTVQDALKASSLAVHLAGPRYGKRPEGTELSIVALQYEIAQQHGLPRVFWIAKRPEEVEPPQADFLKVLRENVQSGLDLLENKTLEDLKDVILERLEPRQPDQAPKTTDNGLVRIYLICDQEDHPLDQETDEQNRALVLRDYLFDAGFEVKLPVSLKTAAASRQKDNREKLKQCDAVLLYWGRAPQVWLEERLVELNKALGWRRSKPFASKAIYVTIPDDKVKRIYRTREARVIAQFDTFSPEPLAPFLVDLRRKPETA